MRISDWSSDVCSSDLPRRPGRKAADLLARGIPIAGRAAFAVPCADRQIIPFMRDRAEQARQDACVMLEIGVDHGDRKSVVSGKSVSVRVDLGGRRIIKKKTTT